MFWGSVCAFLRVTLLEVIVLSRFLENDEIFKDYLTSFTVFLEILKKKKKKKAMRKNPMKMTSQWKDPPPPDPRFEKKFT